MKPVKREAYQRGSLIIPTLAVKDDWLGEVVSVGPEARWVKPGQVAIAPVYHAVEFEVRGEVYRAYHEDNLIAVFDPEELM